MHKDNGLQRAYDHALDPSYYLLAKVRNITISDFFLVGLGVYLLPESMVGKRIIRFAPIFSSVTYVTS